MMTHESLTILMCACRTLPSTEIGHADSFSPSLLDSKEDGAKVARSSTCALALFEQQTLLGTRVSS